MTLFLTVIYGVIFGAWFLLTILWQVDPIRKRSPLLRVFSAFHVLPIWTFFAPRPGMSDTHVLYRDKTLDGDVGPWGEVDLGEERKRTHWLWNPRKRLDKMAVDALSEVKTIKNAGVEADTDEETIQHQVKLSKGYLVLMNIVFSRAKATRASVRRQFAVVDATHSADGRTVLPIFFSPFHDF